MAEGEDLLVHSFAPVMSERIARKITSHWNNMEQNSTSETEPLSSISVFDQPLSVIYCDDDELVNHTFLNSLHNEKNESVPLPLDKILPSVSANSNQLNGCMTEGESALKGSGLEEFASLFPISESDLEAATSPDNDLLELDHMLEDYGQVTNLKKELKTANEKILKFENKLKKSSLKRYSAAGIKYLEKQAEEHEKCENVQKKLELSVQELRTKYIDAITEVENLKLGKKFSDEAFSHLQLEVTKLATTSEVKTRKIKAIRSFVRKIRIVPPVDSAAPAFKKGFRTSKDMQILDEDELEQCNEDCAVIRQMLTGVIGITTEVTKASTELKKELMQKEDESKQITESEEEPEDNSLQYKFQVLAKLITSLVNSRKRLISQLDKKEKRVGVRELKKRIESLREESERLLDDMKTLKAENRALKKELSPEKMKNRIELLNEENQRLDDEFIALKAENHVLEKKLTKKKSIQEDSEGKDASTQTNILIAQDDTEAMVSTSNMICSPFSDESVEEGCDPVVDIVSFQNDENFITQSENNPSASMKVLTPNDTDENSPHSSTTVSEQLSEVELVSCDHISGSSFIEKNAKQSTSIKIFRNRDCDENSPHSSTSMADEGFCSYQPSSDEDMSVCPISPEENNSTSFIGLIDGEDFDDEETYLYESSYDKHVHSFPSGATANLPTPVQDDDDNNKACSIPYLRNFKSLSGICCQMYKRTQNYTLQAQGEEIVDRLSSDLDPVVQQLGEGTSKKGAVFAEVKETSGFLASLLKTSNTAASTSHTILPVTLKTTVNVSDPQTSNSPPNPVLTQGHIQFNSTESGHTVTGERTSKKGAVFDELKETSDFIASLLKTSNTAVSLSHTTLPVTLKTTANVSDPQTSNSPPNSVLTQCHIQVNSTNESGHTGGATISPKRITQPRQLQSSSLTGQQRISVNVPVKRTVDVPLSVKRNNVITIIPFTRSHEPKKLCMSKPPNSVQISDLKVNLKAFEAKVSQKLKTLRSKSVTDPQECYDFSYGPSHNLRKRLSTLPIQTDKKLANQNNVSAPNEFSTIPVTENVSVSEPRTRSQLVNTPSKSTNGSAFPLDRLIPLTDDAAIPKPKRQKKVPKKLRNSGKKPAAVKGKKAVNEKVKPKCYSVPLREALEKLGESKYFPDECIRYRHALVNVIINPSAVHSVEDIISEITTFLVSSNRIPLLSLSHYNSTEQLLPVEEKTLIKALSMIEKKNKVFLHGLSEKFTQHIRQKILCDKTIALPGLLALCRTYTVISKDLGRSIIEMWNFCIAFLKHCSNVFIYGMATIVSVWPQLWQFGRVPEFDCLGKVISRIITEKPKQIFMQIKWDEYLKACDYLFDKISPEIGSWEELLENVCCKLNDSFLSGCAPVEYDKLALKAISLYCGWSGATLYEKCFAVRPDIARSCLSTETLHKAEVHIAIDDSEVKEINRFLVLLQVVRLAAMTIKKEYLQKCASPEYGQFWIKDGAHVAIINMLRFRFCAMKVQMIWPQGHKAWTRAAVSPLNSSSAIHREQTS